MSATQLIENIRDNELKTLLTSMLQQVDIRYDKMVASELIQLVISSKKKVNGRTPWSSANIKDIMQRFGITGLNGNKSELVKRLFDYGEHNTKMGRKDEKTGLVKQVMSVRTDFTEEELRLKTLGTLRGLVKYPDRNAAILDAFRSVPVPPTLESKIPRQGRMFADFRFIVARKNRTLVEEPFDSEMPPVAWYDRHELPLKEIELYVADCLSKIREESDFRFKMKIRSTMVVRDSEERVRVIEINRKNDHIVSIPHENTNGFINRAVENTMETIRLMHSGERLEEEAAGSSSYVLGYGAVVVEIFYNDRIATQIAGPSDLPETFWSKIDYLIDIEQDTKWSKNMCLPLCVAYMVHSYRNGDEITGSKIIKASELDPWVINEVIGLRGETLTRTRDNTEKWVAKRFGYSVTEWSYSGKFDLPNVKQVMGKIEPEKRNKLHINLLVTKTHCWIIRDVKELFHSIIRGVFDSKKKDQYEYCLCCGVVCTKKKLKKHQEQCLETGKFLFNDNHKMKKDKVLKFNNICNVIPVKAIMAMDFETQEQGVNGSHIAKTFGIKAVMFSGKFKGKKPELKELVEKRLHPCSYFNTKICEAKYCMDYIVGSAKSIIKNMDDPVKIIMTRDDYNDYNRATECYICHETFDPDDEDDVDPDEIPEDVQSYEAIGPLTKVRDHDHATGKYLGAACNPCNLLRREKKEIIAFFHNGIGFDNSFLLDHFNRLYELGWKIDSGGTIVMSGCKFKRIRIVPDIKKAKKKCAKHQKCKCKTGTEFKNKEDEKLAGWSVNIVDSMSFFSGSLAKNVEGNKKSGASFSSTNHEFRHIPKEEREGLFKKMSFPYNLAARGKEVNGDFSIDELTIDDFRSFEDSFSTDGVVTVVKDDSEVMKRLESFKESCAEYGLTTMKEAHDHYLKLDVCHLLDVVTEYRKNYYLEDGLDPYRYVTGHSTAFDLMLRSIEGDVPLQLIKSVDLAREVKKCSAAGFSSSLGGNVVAGDETFIEEFDATSMYPTAMKGPLPHRLLRHYDTDIRHIPKPGSPKDINENCRCIDCAPDWRQVSDYGRYMCMIRCNTSFPESTHQKLYKRVPRIAPRLFGPDGKIILDYDENTNGQKKLTRDFYPLENFIFIDEYLKFMEDEGGVISNVTGISIYETSTAIGEKYIQKLAEDRAELKEKMRSASGVEKEKLNRQQNEKKLKMNAVYGKFIENPEKYTRAVVVKGWKNLRNQISNRNMRSVVVLNEDAELYLVNKDYQTVTHTKPYHVAKAILDRSKLIMFKFEKAMVERFGDNVHFHATDTDSLHVSITGMPFEEVYDIIGRQDVPGVTFDLSGVVEERGEHFKKNMDHAGELGSFKVENGGSKVLEGVYRRAKCYSEIIEVRGRGTEYKNVMKGVPRSVVVGELGHDIIKGDDDAPKTCTVGGIIRKKIPGSDEHPRLFTVYNRKKTTELKDEDKFELIKDSNGKQYCHLPWGTCDRVRQMAINREISY